MPMKNVFSQFLIEATGYNITSHLFQRGSETIYLHDPLAVGIVVDPELVRTEKLSIHIETREGEHFGKTLEVPGKGPKDGSGRRKVEVCLGVNPEKFLELFLSRIGA